MWKLSVAQGVKETFQNKGQQSRPLKEQSELIQAIIKLKSIVGRYAKAWTFRSCTFENLCSVCIRNITLSVLPDHNCLRAKLKCLDGKMFEL